VHGRGISHLVAVLASRNAHKARELEVLLPGWTIEIFDEDDYPAEDGATYYENALIKAEFGRSRTSADRWVIGEDSGIEVNALGGRPGLHSARYAPEGAPAIAKLLAELGEETERSAQFVSELVAIAPDLTVVRGSGVLHGRIADASSGVEGFGYDPVFVPDGETQTIAELGDAWKAHGSHRARAARSLHDALDRLGLDV